MATITAREKEITNMPVAVFESYLQNMTEEDYQNYLAFRNTIGPDKSNHGIVAHNIIRNMIACGYSESSFALKLKSLAYLFNQPEYFKELVALDIPKEEIAYTFHTTVENVECQISLNEYVAKQFEANTPKKLIK